MVNLGTNTGEKRIEELKQAKKRLEKNREEEWNKKYALAKAYYEHYGNLEIPRTFKTVNGYEYDGNGIALGPWINTQRNAYKGQSSRRITEEKIDLLSQIGMRFEPNKLEIDWNKKYELAKAYYEHHGNLEIPHKFKTVNGYEYDNNGIALGNWIYIQRNAYKGKGNAKITQQRIELLKKIGMRFETNKLENDWNKKYELAKAYYEYHGNLEISYKFKTVNGYEYDDNGIALGPWINAQRNTYKGQNLRRITKKQIDLLNQIGMRFETNKWEIDWNKKYELAKAYYEHHGNLKIPWTFKTVNGYEYDNNGIALGPWINAQRQAYKGRGTNKITEEKIDLLSQIGMKWFFENIDMKLQKEEINEKNIKRKKIELYNRFIDYLNKYKNDELPSKEEINSKFIKKLDRL